MKIDFLAHINGNYVKQHKTPNTVFIGNRLGYDCKACTKESHLREGSLVVSDAPSFAGIRKLMKHRKVVYDFYSRPADVQHWFEVLPRSFVLKHAVAITFKSPLHKVILEKACKLHHENSFLRVDMILPKQMVAENVERRTGYWVIVGRMIERKVRLENYLPILNSNCRYIVVGKSQDPIGKTFMRKMVATGLVECVGKLSYDQMPAVYRSVEGVMWKPHIVEPSGNPLIEGKICGCKIDGNKLCGNMSWPWFGLEGKQFVRAMEKEQAEFFRRLSEL